MITAVELRALEYMKAFLGKLEPYAPLTITVKGENVTLKWETDFRNDGGWWELWEGTKHRSLTTAADALTLAPYVGAFQRAAFEQQKAHEAILKDYEAAIREFAETSSEDGEPSVKGRQRE